MSESAQATSSTPKRGRKAAPKVDPDTLVGRSHLAVVRDHLGELRRLYPHPNRVLFYDDVVIAYLLAFFNPTPRSLRCLEDASQCPGVNRFLSVEAVCRSTLSDANALFDPAHLKGLVERLRRDLPNLRQADGQLEQLLARASAVDGSYVRVAADVAWALHQGKPDGRAMGQVRLDCSFCLASGCPDGIDVAGDDGVGEGAAAQAMLADGRADGRGDGNGDAGNRAGRIHLFDSGVVKFSCLRAIRDRGGHFLCSLREHVLFDGDGDGHRPLTDADRAAGVVSDRVGHLRSSHAPRGADRGPAGPPREVRVAYVDRHGEPRELRLLTDLLDLPAALIAELYKHRWEVELFVRWLKVHANFRHLTSHSRNGVLLGFHVAVIAMLRTCLHARAPLGKYGYGLLGMAAAGLADVGDVLPILLRREQERRRERDRQARKRAERAAAKAAAKRPA